MFPMEEDDIFQVDKADLIQGPTLAELNANDESLLTDFNFDDFVMPTQMTGRYTKPFNGADVTLLTILLNNCHQFIHSFYVAECGCGSIPDGGIKRCFLRFA